MDKFYVLVVNLDNTNNFAGRSMIYKSYEEALEKAKRYISEGKAKRYHIMESKVTVEVSTPPVVVVKHK